MVPLIVIVNSRKQLGIPMNYAGNVVSGDPGIPTLALQSDIWYHLPHLMDGVCVVWVH
jgi:hypothetical protein